METFYSSKPSLSTRVIAGKTWPKDDRIVIDLDPAEEIVILRFAWPAFLNQGELGRDYDSLQDKAAKGPIFNCEHGRAVMVCRSLGFRRVGSTIWFAMASDRDHPSYKLAADYDPRRRL